MTDFFRDLNESPPSLEDGDKNRYEDFIQQLKLNGGGVFKEDQKDLEDHIQYFLFDGHLSGILDCIRPNDVAKLPDLIANVYRGVYPSLIPSMDTVVHQIFKNTAFAMSKLLLKNGQVLSSLCLNLSSYWGVTERFVRDFHLMSDVGYLPPLMEGLSSMRRSPIYKLYLRHCESSTEIHFLFGDSNEDFFSESRVLLTSQSSFDSRTIGVLLCSFGERALEVLKEFLLLWSNPIIAKANASTEILYYTRVIFITFFHIPRLALKENHLEISKILGEGLPHHFSSTDPRTLKLAKFLSEFLIYTLKQSGVLGDKTQDNSGESPPIHPPDDLSLDLLSSYKQCCPLSRDFWYSKYFESKDKVHKPAGIPRSSDHKSNSPENTDSDDDDDLEPIESLDAPIKCPVIYVRDFIEKLPDFTENIDQMTLVFQRLPTIIDAQLRLEHSSTCKEILEIVFSWNNSFNEAYLDEHRKKSLEAILISSPQVTIPELCRYFHNRPNMIAPEKCLVLDVISRVLLSSKLDLSILKCIADSYFHIILREDPRSIAEQEPPVQIPMVLLSAQVLTRLPNVMSRDSYLKSFLGAINGLILNSADHGMKETIVFALHQICNAPVVSSSSSISPELRVTLGETRNLLSQVLT